ncbi:MAG: hypothetical protein JSR45_15590 [Proteobacteria bacterium]|nr:hypothetical protein [Pseudomonadota bacterium]
MSEAASPRLVHQRLRNRIIEELESVAEGESYVRSWGFSAYFNGVFDWTGPDDAIEPNTAMTAEEAAAWAHFVGVVSQASDDTPRNMDSEAFISTGWPARLADEAARALLAFHRGRLPEDSEVS